MNKVKKISDKKNNILLGIFTIVFIMMIVFVQGLHDTLSPPFTTKFKTVTRTLLPAKILPYIDFGFTNVLADYYWIQAVQDYVLWDTKDLFYLDYFYNITTLDPKFEYPYLFSVWAIPRSKDVAMLDRVAVLAEKGMVAVPTSWKIPFYLGTEYYLYTKSYDPAVKYIKIAVEKKDAPPGAYLTYSSFITKKIEGTKASQELIKIIANNTDNEVIKRLANAGLQESIIDQMLEKGILAYKAQFKKYPKSVDDLITNKFVSFPPELLELFTITIDQSNGSYTLNIKQ